MALVTANVILKLVMLASVSGEMRKMCFLIIRIATPFLIIIIN
jgi:hypothetical protein